MTGMSDDRAVIQISRPIQEWLKSLIDERSQNLKRRITYTEVLEELRDLYEEVA